MTGGRSRQEERNFQLGPTGESVRKKAAGGLSQMKDFRRMVRSRVSKPDIHPANPVNYVGDLSLGGTEGVVGNTMRPTKYPNGNYT